MMVRFFGGWKYTDADMKSREPAFRGYEKGVPMGGICRRPPEGAKAPSFMVYALRDVIGANLDRIQIIKGWLDSDGKTHEKVYDVAWSAGRRTRRRREAAAGGQYRRRRDRELGQHHRRLGAWNRLDRSELRSGAGALSTMRACWKFPLRLGTRTTAFRFGTEIPKDAPTSQQERAYTSPIWYTP